MLLAYCGTLFLGNHVHTSYRVRGPYCKLRPAFFPIDSVMAQARGARAINRSGKNKGRNSQCGPGNDVSKIFITSLYLEIERAKTKFEI